MATSPPAPNPSWRDALSKWLRIGPLRGKWSAFSKPRHDRHQDTYDANYYEFIEFTAVYSQNAMADSIVRDLAPRTVVDLGCGTGALLEALRGRKVKVAGLEYSDAALAYCKKRRLPVRKFDVARHHLPRKLRRRDVALSFEVAEHLPPELADRFVNTLAAASDTVVFSAATPGQGGTDHVNEQPHEYWIDKMSALGFRMDEDLSRRWRDEWRGRTANWYHMNVMVFRRNAYHLKAA
ncbi:MAG TPA: class I SAM-dependent methyltransferase [Lacipirellulaceae bacterium]